MTDSKTSNLAECGINYALKTFVVQTHRNLIYMECSLDLVHILAPKQGHYNQEQILVLHGYWVPPSFFLKTSWFDFI